MRADLDDESSLEPALEGAYGAFGAAPRRRTTRG
ncbi:hypothetical protein AB0P36_34650 [Streptomyces flavidovirens]